MIVIGVVVFHCPAILAPLLLLALAGSTVESLLEVVFARVPQ